MSLLDHDGPLAEKLDDALTEDELARAWSSVPSARERKARARERRRVAGAALALLLLIGGGAFVFLRDDGPGPLTRADGGALHAISDTSRVTLSDASRIEVAEHGEVRVLRNEADATALHLTRGRARFVITPHTGRRWSVEADGVIVEVVGTVFTVDRDGGVAVEVERGVVLVRGRGVPDGVARLTAGERIEIASRAEVLGATERARASDIEDPPSETQEPTVTETLAVRPPRSGSASASQAWSGREPPANRVTESREAPVTDEPAQPPPSEPSAPSSRDLLERADDLRASGEPARAIPVLRQIVDQHPDSSEAPLAAYTLAGLLADAGRTADAASWYRRALRLGLPPALAETAREALTELHDDGQVPR